MDEGGSGDVVVMATFFHDPHGGSVWGMPGINSWTLRVTSDWLGYRTPFEAHPSGDGEAVLDDHDGSPFHVTGSMAPFSVLIYSP